MFNKQVMIKLQQQVLGFIKCMLIIQDMLIIHMLIPEFDCISKRHLGREGRGWIYILSQLGGVYKRS